MHRPSNLRLGLLAAVAACSGTAGAQPTVLQSSSPAPGLKPVTAVQAPAATPRDNSRPVSPGGIVGAPLASRPVAPLGGGRSASDNVGPGNGQGGGVADSGITMIDMETLTYNDAGQHDAGREYIENGFVVSEDLQDAFNLQVLGTQNSSYCGSTALFNNTVGGTTYLYAVDYSPFTLEYMEFANLNPGGQSTITVHGYKQDGTVVTNVCTLSTDDLREETFYFQGFNDLFYISWTQDEPYHQFDNIGVVRAPVVLDFQTLEVNDPSSHDQGHSVYEDGFILDNSGDIDDFYTFGTQDARYPGSTALFNNTVGGTTTLTQYEGGPFTIHSMDLSNLNGNGPCNVTFTGHRPGGSTITKTVKIVGQGNGLQTFQFAGFNNIESLTWTQDAPFHQFDNIVISRGQQTLDFAKLTQYDDQTHAWGGLYRQDGFRITDANNDLGTFGVNEPRFAGSTALYNNNINGVSHLDTIDGALFQMTGIELSELNGWGAATVHFTGHKGDGSQVDKEFTTSGDGIRLETFQFDESWRGLKDVEWAQTYPYHQFDNIRLVRQTSLMDFQQLEHVDNQYTYVGKFYGENGFKLTKGANEPYDFATDGTKYSGYNGSTSIFNNTDHGLIHLAATDGGDFDLLQMDLSSLVAGLGNVTVTFVGTKTDNSQVSQTFTIDGTWLIEQTCRFVGFDSLKYVEWYQDAPYHQIDNIVAVESAKDCYPDCDGNGTLDLFDFLCFVNSFNANAPYANCDGNGSLDLFDFLCYVNAFNGGC